MVQTNLRKIWDAFGYSLCGLKEAWKSELAFRSEIVAPQSHWPFTTAGIRSGVTVHGVKPRERLPLPLTPQITLATIGRLPNRLL